MNENLNNLSHENQPAEPLNPQSAGVSEDISSSSAGQGYTVTSQGEYFSFDPASQQPPTPPYTPPAAPVTDYSAPSCSPQPTYAQPKKPKKEKKAKGGASVLTVIIAALLAAIIGAGSAVAIVFSVYDPTLIGKTETPVKNNSTAQGNGGTVNIDVSDLDATMVEAVAEKVTPSVVGIRTTVAVNNFFYGTQESSGEGSGVIYTSDGYIITNYHVIAEAVEYKTSRIQVYLSNDAETGYDATVVGYNISCDLAVIKIDAKNLPAITIAKSEDLKTGQFVVAIGNPGGLEFMGSVTYGVISGLNRIVSDSYDSQSVELIQTDAAINPGNSGGALVNVKGELVGINSSKIVSAGYEGMGFAIPSDTVISICKRIIDKKDSPTPYIGVSINTQYDAEALEILGYPIGAVVESVSEGSPAEDAGLRRGDIITEFNGTEITGYNTLIDAVALCDPGETVSITVYRKRSEYTGKITVGSNNAQ